jgi:hypothetical protein
MNFIANAFTMATLSWVAAFLFQVIGFDLGWVATGLAAMMFSALAFTSLIVGGLVWTVRHVRIVII